MNKNRIMSAIVGLVIVGLAVYAASMREPMGDGPRGGMMINPSSTQAMGSSSTGVPPTDADGDGDEVSPPVTVPNRY